MSLLGPTIDPLSLGLLSAGSALMSSRRGLAQAPMAFAQGLLSGQDAQRQARTDEMRMQLLQGQLGALESQAEHRRALTTKAEDEVRRAAATRVMRDGVVQRIVARAQEGGQPQITAQDVGEYVAAGGKIEELQAMAASGQWGRPEVARTIEFADESGVPMLQQLDKFGAPVGAPVRKPVQLNMTNRGGSITPTNPYTGAAAGADLSVTNTPDALLTDERMRREGALNRGQQLSIAQMSDARAREANATASSNREAFQYIQTPQGLVAVPRQAGDGPVQARPVVDASGARVGVDANTGSAQRVREARDALQLIDQAERLIGRSTGSYAGVAYDMAAQVFGIPTEGAQASAQLKAIEGALVAKMPKMSGPQSDKDVLLYRQMAGQVGDPTIPANTKRAALQTIREIQERYASEGGGATGSWDALRDSARRELERRGVR